MAVSREHTHQAQFSDAECLQEDQPGIDRKESFYSEKIVMPGALQFMLERAGFRKQDYEDVMPPLHVEATPSWDDFETEMDPSIMSGSLIVRSEEWMSPSLHSVGGEGEWDSERENWYSPDQSDHKLTDKTDGHLEHSLAGQSEHHPTDEYPKDKLDHNPMDQSEHYSMAHDRHSLDQSEGNPIDQSDHNSGDKPEHDSNQSKPYSIDQPDYSPLDQPELHPIDQSGSSQAAKPEENPASHHTEQIQDIGVAHEHSGHRRENVIPGAQTPRSDSIEIMNETFTSWELYDLSEAREEMGYDIASNSGNSE